MVNLLITEQRIQCNVTPRMLIISAKRYRVHCPQLLNKFRHYSLNDPPLQFFHFPLQLSAVNDIHSTVVVGSSLAMTTLKQSCPVYYERKKIRVQLSSNNKFCYFNFVFRHCCQQDFTFQPTLSCSNGMLLSPLDLFFNCVWV